MSGSHGHGHAQCELLQRVARQALSKEQCDSLIYHICAPSNNHSTSAATVYGGTSNSMGQPMGGGTYLTGLFQSYLSLTRSIPNMTSLLISLYPNLTLTYL